MEILLVAIAVLAAVTLLWLNTLATLAVKYDHTLDKTQKITQSFIVWLVPFIGAGFVLHLVVGHYPQAIPRGWIPWPFRKMIYGEPRKPNNNRDENEIDYAGTSSGRRHSGREANDASDSD